MAEPQARSTMQSMTIIPPMRDTALLVLFMVIAAIVLNLILISMGGQTNLQLPMFDPDASFTDFSEAKINKSATSKMWSIELVPDPNIPNSNQSETAPNIADPVHIPFSHLPKLDMIPYDELVEAEGKSRTPCDFKGKVFVLGMSKTGTSTMKEVLHHELKYQCITGPNPMITCGYYGMYWYMRSTMLPLYVAPDDISWAMFSRPFWTDFNEALRKSNVFHDAPWNYLYPYYDQMIPRNHSKFILLLRNSTRDLVNSNMKMYVRGRKKREKMPPEEQYDYTNWTISPRQSGLQVTWKDFWMLTARAYEKHNENVMEYFRARGRMDDLLILNLREESKRMPFSEQWFKITNFLGCPNISKKGLPHQNTAKEMDDKNHVVQIDFFPKDFVIDWKKYKLPREVRRIVDGVKAMNGTFDPLLWKKLNRTYGFLFFDKKQT